MYTYKDVYSYIGTHTFLQETTEFFAYNVGLSIVYFQAG